MALRILEAYDWPGNVKELENVMERAVIFSMDGSIGDGDILLPRHRETDHESFREAKSLMVAQFEQNYIRKLLRAHGGNISRAAKAARKNRRAFWELIRKYEIDVRSITSDSL